ncbi:gag-pol polyprotein [Cucumis melo var. makuwa]|uniref:Gag-pol polyprotein n=1 Tax=Cucumis melo var. makuwa TaxID=1194695 RepID=A0A5D3DMG6_CUCMM|nr:gag-pol polyprotein [Cucumis melo var. makuwa]TYK24801.1 gag-pol polyprotein [Cucumis melo var. makuwa]
MPHMIFFIKILDGKAWRVVVGGYEPPMITVNGVSVPKPEIDWTDAEEKASVGNARAINAMFNGVDLNIFKLINSYTTAKEAWKILEVAYEGTSKVKISRLQLITSKFEALKMTEDETVSEYNERVLEIANDSLLLAEKIPESKIVCKVLRSLPRKFDMKVTAIEEAQDITTLKLDELFGSLLTFEMAISDRESKKGKRIAFKSVYDQENTVNQSEINSEADSESSNINEDEELTLEELKILRKEDSEARAIQKERIQDLMDENERLMGIISSLKVKLKKVQNVYDQTIKSVKMLNYGTDSLDSILSSGQNGSSKYSSDLILQIRVSRLLQKKGHIRSFCYKLLRDRRHQQRPKCGNKQNQYRTIKRNNDVRGTHWIWRVMTSGKCNVAFTTVQTHVDAWYFDSGCSRIMTGNRSFFTELEECTSGHVTFRDGAKGKIIAKGNIDKRGKKYVLVVVDDYSRFTWVRFLKGKSDTGKLCISLCLNLQREKGQKIIRIRTDHEKEFDNEDLNNLCQTEGIHHEFAAPITPHQNGVVEQKNKTLQEMARVMIHAKDLPLNFWAEAVNTTCHIHNKNSRAYRVFNIKSRTVMETINVVVNDFESNINQFNIEDDETYVTPEVTSTPLYEMPKDE